MKKIFTVLLFATFPILATIDDTQGFYRPGTPYYNYGSSYYLNPGIDYRWDGNGWIFQTGYKLPVGRCQHYSKKSCSGKKCRY